MWVLETCKAESAEEQRITVSIKRGGAVLVNPWAMNARISVKTE